MRDDRREVMLDLYEELKELITQLKNAKLNYALCGGLALAVYGITRATVDIDLVIQKDSLKEVLTVARILGFAIKANPMTFAKGAIEIHRIEKIDPEAGDILMLDLLLVTPEIEEVWKSRQEIEWENGKLWVVSPAGLISLKSLRGSGQDLEDIKRLKEGFYET